MLQSYYVYIEGNYTTTHRAVAGMIATLPLAVLDDKRVYNWLYGIAVEHSLVHQTPGEPQTPSAQYTQVHPESGEHLPPDDDSPPYAGYRDRETGVHSRMFSLNQRHCME